MGIRQKQRRERREYLEREYRYRLQQQQGASIRPEDFAAPDKPEEGKKIGIGGGGRDAGECDLGTQMHLYGTLTETGFFVMPRDVGLAEAAPWT